MVRPKSRGGRAVSVIVLGCLILAGAVANTQPTAAQDPWWMPGVGITWQIQLNRPPTAAQVIPGLDAYEIDLFETTPQRIAQIKATGAKVICYFSAGTYENWRPDRRRFPQRAIGNPLDDWPGERYVDIRNQKVRRIMLSRLDLAVRKGCDAVDRPEGTRQRRRLPQRQRLPADAPESTELQPLPRQRRPRARPGDRPQE